MHINSEEAHTTKPKNQLSTPELIFKYINIVIVLILLFCIQGFLRFREHSIEQGYYVFSTDSLIWCAAGFFGIFVSGLACRY